HRYGKVLDMAMREMGLGFATTALVIGSLSLIACGKATRGDGPRGNAPSGSSGSSQSGGRDAASGSTGSPGSSGSSGSTGSLGGSYGVGGETGGSATTAGNGDGAGGAGSPGGGDAGGGGVGKGGGRASLHWIDGTDEHRARAASSQKPARLRTLVLPPPHGASALVGTSELIIGKNTEELYMEGIVWTAEMGTTALGGLPGVIQRPFWLLSSAHAVSADGSVVVGAARSSQDIIMPFRWTRADGMEPLAESGTAEAVSADGSVVVGSVSTDGMKQALFRWTRERGAVTIIEPLPGDDVTRVLALSDDGGTVLGLSELSDERQSRLVVWTEGSGVRAIENVPGYPRCIAEFAEFDPTHGIVAAGWCSNEVDYEPFLWAGQDALVALGPADALDGYVRHGSVAVTADGSVAVGVASGPDNAVRGYRWTEGEGFELMELPEGYTSIRLGRPAEALSADGSVVAGTLDSGVYRAFRWSEDAGTVVLPPLEGHDVSSASAVSPDGSVVAGTSQLGTTDQTAVYWLADGVPHRIADELEAHGIELGAGKLQSVRAVQAPLTFLGHGARDELSTEIMWRATLP
ncbi:MAG TPA: hypothetical protein VIM73_20510, partial [Polyangiaceae bacterium]